MYIQHIVRCFDQTSPTACVGSLLASALFVVSKEQASILHPRQWFEARARHVVRNPLTLYRLAAPDMLAYVRCVCTTNTNNYSDNGTTMIEWLWFSSSMLEKGLFIYSFLIFSKWFCVIVSIRLNSVEINIKCS